MTTSTACELLSPGEIVDGLEVVAGLDLQGMLMAGMLQLVGQLSAFLVDEEPIALPASIDGSAVGTIANNAPHVFF